MNSNSINIFQKNWAFTSSDSEKTEIKTTGFGPCYVVTFTSGKFAAMAHIDDNTDVDSMMSIFNKFKQNSIDLKDVKVIVLGGWKDHPESYKWGNKVLKKISESGFENVSTKNMHTKKMVTIFHQLQGLSKSNIHPFYYFGARVDSCTGKTFILQEYSESLEKEGERQLDEFAKKYSHDLRTEISLTQVIN